jgi:hypothetical protein
MNLHIDIKTLLTLDSTIIGGFLILLTISSFSQTEFPNRSIFVSIAVIIVILFSIACFFGLFDKIENAIKFSKMGFVSIIVFMMFIGIVNIINIIDPTIWSKQPIASKIAKSNSTVPKSNYSKDTNKNNISNKFKSNFSV